MIGVRKLAADDVQRTVIRRCLHCVEKAKEGNGRGGKGEGRRKSGQEGRGGREGEDQTHHRQKFLLCHLYNNRMLEISQKLSFFSQTSHITRRLCCVQVPVASSR